MESDSVVKESQNEAKPQSESEAESQSENEAKPQSESEAESQNLKVEKVEEAETEVEKLEVHVHENSEHSVDTESDSQNKMCQNEKGVSSNSLSVDGKINGRSDTFIFYTVPKIYWPVGIVI